MFKNLIQMDTANVALSPLEAFIKAEQGYMTKALKAIVKDCKSSIRPNPSLYIDGDGEPAIDVRLCIDKVHTNSNPFSLCSDLEERFDWGFRTGDSSYDQRHSRYCGASSIGLDSKVEDVLTELVDQILEQES